MAPSSFEYDLWANEPTSEFVNVECLMPNSIVIILKVNREVTLLELKEDLWDEAQRHPLYGTLRDRQSYIFVCVNYQLRKEELVDEMRKLCDVRPFQFILKVVERKGDEAAKRLDMQIGNLISKGLHEFDALKNPEVNEFRWRMRAVCEDIAREREQNDWINKVLYKYPVRLASDPQLPKMLSNKLKDNNLVILVRLENVERSFTFCVSSDIKPKQFLQVVLSKKAHTTGQPEENVEEYALKVCGHEEFLLADCPLSQYMYIQSMISEGKNPQLVTVSMQSIMIDMEEPFDNVDDMANRRSKSSFSTMTLGSRKKPNKYVISWTISKQFSFNVNAICKLNCEATEVAVQAGLFHGGESLCEPQKTREVVAVDGEAKWEEDLNFDIDVSNIPRMTRLCLVVYEISKNAKGAKHRRSKGSKQDGFVNALAWVNTTVYDFRNQLKVGPITLYMWTYAEDIQNEDMLHPLGTTVSNPNVEQSAVLTVAFHRYHGENNIVYPTIEKIRELVVEIQNQDSSSSSHGTTHASKTHLEQLRQMCDRDPLHQMHEQDKELMWFLRQDCLTHLPHSLSKLLQCTKWSDYKYVAQMMDLLLRWPRLAPEHALELLDYAYADQEIRKFAVECLRGISDEELLLYLLQLVQALKHESYLYSDLVEFLLGRALRNQSIGSYFFWHLRSEMHVPAVSVRFGLILEAYCRGSIEHTKNLAQDISILSKLKELNEQIRQKKDTREKARHFMSETISKNSFVDSICNWQLPLNPSLKCRSIKVEKCKFMDSKMKPLWLVFENEDPYGDDIFCIFKNGDDLRQDMLTLQMIRIMDKLWKDEGLDLRMTPYGCISTDFKVGLIEVVLNANTIANIQKEKGLFTATSTLKKGSLLAWFKDHNPDEKSLNKAIEEFTLSCAGYCVATYVLGIADRHSDNIMVKTNGQLFHIDFGHILGNFKEKFGIRRERVPFVLTHDFVYVITKGQTQKSQEFSRFQNDCEQAFLILRRKGSLIISLFAMMLSTGIPELMREKDLSYLRDTLVLDLPETEALKHFRSKFDEALRNSWKTSVNWLAHNLAKDNKMDG